MTARDGGGQGRAERAVAPGARVTAAGWPVLRHRLVRDGDGTSPRGVTQLAGLPRSRVPPRFGPFPGFHPAHPNRRRHGHGVARHGGDGARGTVGMAQTGTGEGQGTWDHRDRAPRGRGAGAIPAMVTTGMMGGGTRGTAGPSGVSPSLRVPVTFLLPSPAHSRTITWAGSAPTTPPGPIRAAVTRRGDTHTHNPEDTGQDFRS